MSTEGQDSFSHEGLSPEEVALRQKRLDAKKAKNQKRRSRKKQKKKLKNANMCGVCAKELCNCDGGCFNNAATGLDKCNCIPTCNECYIRHFIGNGRRCADSWCSRWHISCPGGCGTTYRGSLYTHYPLYKTSAEHAEWCFNSAPGIFNRE